jgi:hypothetical protein
MTKPPLLPTEGEVDDEDCGQDAEEAAQEAPEDVGQGQPVAAVADELERFLLQRREVVNPPQKPVPSRRYTSRRPGAARSRTTRARSARMNDPETLTANVPHGNAPAPGRVSIHRPTT